MNCTLNYSVPQPQVVPFYLPFADEPDGYCRKVSLVL